MEQINQTNNTHAPSESIESAKSMQDIEKSFFAVEQLEAGMEYVNEAIELATNDGADPVFNFNPEEELPEGYGIAVIPVTQRVPERGNQTINIVIAAIPDFSVVMADDAGRNWAAKQLQDAMMRQVLQAAKPKDEGALVSIPFKLSEFITSTRASGMVAFNMLASLFVSALKKKGLKFMTKVLLRQVLASAAFAEQQFPRIGQENWRLLLEAMIHQASKKGEDAGILAHWLKTRDATEIDTSELDLSDIEGMLESNKE